MTPTPADQGEFRMNNSPKPLVAPIKRVESLTNWGSDSGKATVLLRPRKPFNQQGDIWAVLQNSICVWDIEAKSKFSGWTTRSGFYSQLLWLRQTHSYEPRIHSCFWPWTQFEWGVRFQLLQPSVSLEKQELLELVFFLPTSLEDTGHYDYGISMMGSTCLSLYTTHYCQEGLTSGAW